MGSSLYAADPADLVRTVELDGLTALFHLPSGMTHILAPPAPQILAILGQTPATPAKLLVRIKQEFALEAARGARAMLQARLDELEAAGLVWRL